MIAPSRRFFASAGAAAGMLLVLVMLRPSLLKEDARPESVSELAAWLAKHPVDARAARELTARALDSDVPQRVALWRNAYLHARRLEPLDPRAAIAFVRSGLFHWTELTSEDQRAVLAAAAPLLGDRANFEQLHAALFRLTRDLNYLRSNAPATPEATRQLRDLALAHGLFDAYRQLREEARSRSVAVFDAKRGTAPIWELLNLMPDRADAADAPLLERLLLEISRRTPASGGDRRVAQLIAMSLDLRLQLPAGLATLIDAEWLPAHVRARLALALGNASAASRIALAGAAPHDEEWNAYFAERALHEARSGDRAAAEQSLADASQRRHPAAAAGLAARVYKALGDASRAASFERSLKAGDASAWRGLCGSDLCGSATTFAAFGSESLRVDVVQSDEIAPYIEIYIDGALAVEGAIDGSRTFQLTSPRAVHEVEVRLVNRLTRAGIQRRARMS